ncbi:pogo transposable [Stemphylium lycopersici]|nr:pogo transposable [Stemphylium lycopersici]
MAQYEVDARHTYNMDEKGFLIGITSRSKRVFSRAAWERKEAAWCASFREESIKKAFKVTGIHPPDPQPVLKKFQSSTPELSSSDESLSSVLSGEDWRKIRALITETTQDRDSKGVKKLQRSLHHIATQNDLLRHEIQGLRASLAIKKRHKKKSFTLQDHIQEEYHGGAVFWSPKRVQEARAFEAAKQQEKDELQLQKIQRYQEKEQSKLAKAQQAEQQRVERERAKEVRVKEKADKAAQRAAKKTYQKAIQDSKKAIQLSQKGKRKASQAQGLSNKRQKVVGGGVVASPSPPPLAKTTRRGRNINLPSKYK